MKKEIPLLWMILDDFKLKLNSSEMKMPGKN